MMSTTVLADVQDEFSNILEKNTKATSFAGKTVVTAELNEPLQIFEDIPKDDYVDLDYTLLSNDLMKSKFTVEFAYNVAPDYKKMQMSVSMACDLPVHINNDLKIDAYGKFGVWCNYDVTDSENPKLEIIQKNPVDPYYSYGDFFDTYGEELTKAITPDAIKGAVDGFARALNDNAEIKKTTQGYKVKIDNDSFKGFISDSALMLKKYIPDPEFKEFIKNQLPDFDFDLLGKNGAVIEVTKNSKGEIAAYTQSIHLDFNLYDLAEYLGIPADGLVKEKSQIDVTFKEASEFFGYNKTTVDLPELTEENSRPIYAGSSHGYYSSEESPLFKDNIVYYPLDEVLKLTSIDAKVEENKVILGDEVFECDEMQLYKTDNKVYVTEAVLEFIDIRYLGVDYDMDEDRFNFSFFYEEEEEYFDDYYEDDSQPQYLDISFELERAPYANDGIFYMPVFELLCEMGEGEFKYGIKTLRYTAKTDNYDGIKTFFVRDGDPFVIVNDEKIAIEAPAMDVNGVLNIPVSFVHEYGYSAEINSDFSVGGEGYAHTLYYFEKPNPMYVEREDENPYLFVSIVSDQLPHIENGEVCVPLYDFLYEMYDGEFSFTPNGMEYVATSENEYGITKVSVTIGDNFVMVDDKKVEFENKVVRVNDIIRVPLEFVKNMGFSIDWIYLDNNNTATFYDFSMPNPNYTK